MVPGGKALPFGGSFGEYSLNDLEQPAEHKQQEKSKVKEELQMLSLKKLSRLYVGPLLTNH